MGARHGHGFFIANDLAKAGACASLAACFVIPALFFVVTKLLRRLAFILLGLFLALEAVLWVFVKIPQEPLKRVDLNNDITGFRKASRVSFDRYVARYLDDKNSSAKPPGTVRILCLGGSGTLAMLQSAEDTWWGQLGRMLQQKGLPVEVGAWGQDKAGIIASTPVAERLMEEWKPDIVIGNFGFDDVVSQPMDYTYAADKARRLTPAPRPTGWKEAVLAVSQTARLGRLWARNNEAAALQNTLGRPDHYRDIFDELRKKINATRFYSPQPRVMPDDPVKEYLDGWTILSTLANRHGATLVMTGEAALDESTLMPSLAENLLALSVVNKSASSGEARFMRPDPAWVEQEMRRYAESAESLAGELKAPWLDLNGRVLRDRDHFFSDVMLTDAGATIAAAVLLPAVEPIVKSKAGR